MSLDNAWWVICTCKILEYWLRTPQDNNFLWDLILWQVREVAWLYRITFFRTNNYVGSLASQLADLYSCSFGGIASPAHRNTVWGHCIDNFLCSSGCQYHMTPVLMNMLLVSFTDHWTKFEDSHRRFSLLHHLQLAVLVKPAVNFMPGHVTTQISCSEHRLSSNVLRQSFRVLASEAK